MRAPPLTGMFPAPTTSSLKAVFATVPRVALLIFHQRSRSGAPTVKLAPTCFIRPKGRGGGRGRRQGSCADLATIGGIGARRAAPTTARDLFPVPRVSL